MGNQCALCTCENEDGIPYVINPVPFLDLQAPCDWPEPRADGGVAKDVDDGDSDGDPALPRRPAEEGVPPGQLLPRLRGLLRRYGRRRGDRCRTRRRRRRGAAQRCRGLRKLQLQPGDVFVGASAICRKATAGSAAACGKLDGDSSQSPS